MGKTVIKEWVSDEIDGIEVSKNIPCNASNYKACKSRVVSYVVMHYTGNAKDTAKGNATYFQGSGRNASAHFFVDETSIYQSMPLHDIAWHCGAHKYAHKYCRNINAIGIEMCTSGNSKVSEKTKKHAANLCAYICRELGITGDQVDTCVLRHYDVTHKRCPAQMVDSPDEWKAFKKQVKDILNGKK